MPFGSSAFVSGIFNRSSARQSQKHSERMFKHRYQWASEDMRKAGINPLLLQSHGPGSASPSAQAAPIDTSKSFSAGALQRAGIKTAQTEQQKNVAAAEASNAQAQLAAENARSARTEANIREIVAQNWSDPNMQPMLSTSRAMTDAGMPPWAGMGGGGIKGFFENLGSGTAKGGEAARRWYEEHFGKNAVPKKINENATAKDVDDGARAAKLLREFRKKDRKKKKSNYHSGSWRKK